MKRVIALVLAFGYFGCSSLIRQPYDRAKEYRRDIRLSVQGFDERGKRIWERAGKGVMTVPPAHSYRIEGEAIGEFDFLVWQTCSRQESLERQGDSFRIDTYRPTSIERGCGDLLEIRGVEEKKRRNSGALILFESPHIYALKARLSCNGVDTAPGGDSICQAKQGLLQGIAFDRKVFVATEPKECELKGTDRANEFVFAMPKRRCFYVFGDKEARHRILLSPYEDITITREEE